MRMLRGELASGCAASRCGRHCNTQWTELVQRFRFDDRFPLVSTPLDSCNMGIMDGSQYARLVESRDEGNETSLVRVFHQLEVVEVTFLADETLFWNLRIKCEACHANCHATVDMVGLITMLTSA